MVMCDPYEQAARPALIYFYNDSTPSGHGHFNCIFYRDLYLQAALEA